MEGLTLTSTMFDGLISAITGNLGVLIPVGLTIMGIMVAVSLIPRIVYKFFFSFIIFHYRTIFRPMVIMFIYNFI